MTTKNSITVSLATLTLTRTRTSSGGKEVYEVKGLELPGIEGAKVYVQAYVPPAESAPAPAAPVKPTTRKAKGKDLSQPATPAPSAAPATDAPPAWFAAWLAAGAPGVAK